MYRSAMTRTGYAETLGLVLAGGRSQRMGGRDKPLCVVGGQSILARVIARLQPQCDGLLLNANGDHARFAAFGLPIAPDDLSGFAGPLAGVLAGLDWAATRRPNVRWVLSVAADCPFIPHDLAARLHQARIAHAAPIAVCASGGRTHPVIALWDVALRGALRHDLEAEQLRRVGGFIARHPSIAVDWPTAPLDPFFNVNTPDDLVTAERLAALEVARR